MVGNCGEKSQNELLYNSKTWCSEQLSNEQCGAVYGKAEEQGVELKRISNVSLKCDVKYSLKKLFTFTLPIPPKKGVKLHVLESFEQLPSTLYSRKHTVAAVRLQKLSKHDFTQKYDDLDTTPATAHFIMRAWSK